MKEKAFANKELEMEKQELELERKKLIEEKIKFEEIMRELFEEEMRRGEEDSDSDDEAEDNSHEENRKVRTAHKSKPSTARRSRAASPEDEDDEEETVPLRKSRWYPEVGKAPAPNLKKIRTNIDNVNRRYQPRSARKVEIFHDTEYLKNVKEAKLLSARPHQRTKSNRPRSLVLQKVDQDNHHQHRYHE